ncbi:oxygenase MpaB family protein [Sinorhizobium sp. BG8]|uniref:oxygenase MpaB family protein n=1 Tax=Sinorhizobium sp. BG8 TaxID=2613773 RepID=UPI00193E9322|nr:oxygenase MpaB family protein [Sinorhizobium sp. BG8]QRM56283.1 DUF2236 domain-containing protein [Sinorhizobium sp. BG8]
MLHVPRILPLPGPLHDRLDGLVSSFLAEAGTPIDFSRPYGEEALVPADSISWRIFKNQVSLFIGGVAAVLLEMAEPKVRDGVWHHTTFRTDALRRLQRTGLAAMVTVYAGRRSAEAMIANVVRMHARIRGRTSEGEAYEANDPELLDWVQATATFGFMQAYHTYVSPLSNREKDELLAEGRPIAALYGAVGAPASMKEMDALFERMAPRLVSSPIIGEFLRIMSDVDALPSPARPLQRMLLKAAVELLPGWVRARLALGNSWSLSPLEKAAVKMAAKLNDRVVLSSSPPVQACRRLGLPDEYLYRSRAKTTGGTPIPPARS